MATSNLLSTLQAARAMQQKMPKAEASMIEEAATGIAERLILSTTPPHHQPMENSVLLIRDSQWLLWRREASHDTLDDEEDVLPSKRKGKKDGIKPKEEKPEEGKTRPEAGIHHLVLEEIVRLTKTKGTKNTMNSKNKNEAGQHNATTIACLQHYVQCASVLSPFSVVFCFDQVFDHENQKRDNNNERKEVEAISNVFVFQQIALLLSCIQTIDDHHQQGSSSAKEEGVDSGVIGTWHDALQHFGKSIFFKIIEVVYVLLLHSIQRGELLIAMVGLKIAERCVETLVMDATKETEENVEHSGGEMELVKGRRGKKRGGTEQGTVLYSHVEECAHRIKELAAVVGKWSLVEPGAAIGKITSECGSRSTAKKEPEILPFAAHGFSVQREAQLHYEDLEL